VALHICCITFSNKQAKNKTQLRHRQPTSFHLEILHSLAFSHMHLALIAFAQDFMTFQARPRSFSFSSA
jgi:hypothetical protein